MFRSSCRLLVVALVAAGLTHAPAAPAPRGPFAEGARVEVRSGADWRPATVVRREGTKVEVRYEDAGGGTAQVPLGRLRPARPARTAERPHGPASGSGPAPATLPSDDRIPPLITADLSRVAHVDLSQGSAGTWQATPDPGAESPFKGTAARVLPLRPSSGQHAFFERPAAVLFAPARPATGFVCFTAQIPGRSTGELRIERCNLLTLRSEGSATLAHGDLPLALSADGSRFLSAGGMSFAAHDRLDLWQVDGREPRHLVSWTPYGPEQPGSRDVHWAAFADPAQVLTVNARGELLWWDAPKARAVYRANLQPLVPPAMSPGGKLLAVAARGGGICILETRTGRLLGWMDAKAAVTRLQFDPGGRRLAALSPGRVQVWELESSKSLHDVFFPGETRSSEFTWAGEGHLLLEDGSLIDLERRIVLWRYDSAAPGSLRTSGAFAGRYWYIATEGRNRGAERALVSVLLPHADARKAAEPLVPKDLLALEPGTRVSLELHLTAPPDVVERVRQSILRNLAGAGLQHADDADIRLAAASAPGRTREVTYQFVGRGSSTVPVSDLELSLTMARGRTLWKQQATFSAPFLISVRKDEMADQAVAREREKAWGWFETTPLPTHLPDADKAGPYGRSLLTASGIEPARGQPPPQQK